MKRARLADDHPFAIGARALAASCLAAIIVASLGPSDWLPRLLYSNNLEHFAAFYVVALVLYAARYRSPRIRILRDTALLATALETAKWVLPGPRPASFEHWIADMGGILAAAAPLQVAEFRRRFARAAAESDGL